MTDLFAPLAFRSGHVMKNRFMLAPLTNTQSHADGTLSDDEFLRMHNFGRKSLDELKERLALRGFISPEAASGDADESDLPASAELDEAAAAELDREA